MGRIQAVLATMWLLGALGVVPVSAGAVVIGFEGLADGTVVTSQFPGVSFSSETDSEIRVTEQPGLGFGDKFVCTATPGGGFGCNAEVILSFSQPVEDLSFFAVADNAAGVIARVDVFTAGPLPTTVDVVSDDGLPFTQVPIDLSAFAGVTSIRVHSVTDPGGLGFDQFSFVAVPEPATATLLLAGLLWLGAGRRALD